MTATLTAPAATATRTMGDLLRQLGDIPPERVLLHPAPGTATEADVIQLENREDRLAELVDGVLVEKALGFIESAIAAAIVQILRNFVEENDLGIVTGADGMMRLFPGLVRIPDAAFVVWEHVPGEEIPSTPIADLCSDLAVEVLSKSNTAKEMSRKCNEYFQSGARLVWLVNPRKRTITVYTSPENSQVFDERQVLDGGSVLPGFAVPVRRIFGGQKRKKKTT